MKKTILLLLIFCSTIYRAQRIDPAYRFQGLSILYDNSDVVFEGEFSKMQPPFITPDRKIFTVYEFTVDRMIKGTMPTNGIITIEVDGGYIADPDASADEPYLLDNEASPHGNGFVFSQKKLIFCTGPNDNGFLRLLENFGISNASSIEYGRAYYEFKPYVTLPDLYTDLSIISGMFLRTANPNSNPEPNIAAPEQLLEKDSQIDLAALTRQRLQTYNEILSTKQKALQNNLQQRSAAITNLDVQLTNGAVVGGNYEFDVYVRADNTTSYMDNLPIWIQYNPVVFGSNITGANNWSVTLQGNFNTANYIPANSTLIDASANTAVFLLGAITSTSVVRVNITTSYQIFAHVVMKLSGCGNVNINLTNSSGALNSAWYSTTASGAATGFYDGLNYFGSFNTPITVCPMSIFDFTSPINGGLNQTLQIRGSNFGATRGNGQVKFRCMDDYGFPYMKMLDDMDYISWNDSIIQVRMPGTIDTLNFGTGASKYWTPGSGDFKVVKNNATDSTKSAFNLTANRFEVYYSITNDRPGTTATISRGQKLKRHLYKSVLSSGGYVIQLDTSISNYPLRVACVKKAIKDWACLTAVNIKLGNDTIFQGYGVNDKICNVSIVNANQMSAASFIAETKQNISICPGPPSLKVVNDFDIRINRNYTPIFFCDTTLATLPINNIDFLEVMYHEIGHGISLNHVRDSSAVMFYKTLGNLTFTVSGLNRRRLIPYTSDVDGGDNSVSTSLAAISGQCGLQDMNLLNAGSCAVVGLMELLKNNFNANVYPNPSTNGKFTLTFDAIDGAKPVIEVMDLTGKVVYKETLTNYYNDHYVHAFDVNNLDSGIYILNIKQNNLTSSFKLIKQ